MLHSQRAGMAENRQNAVCQMDHGGRSQRLLAEYSAT
ncbi:hypothetical protein IMSAGC002_00419 [Lachnospiraceae bacterium]|jgi:hypothetical protein|nr:hypothetical protein IMSAGC002_00419 [Lachnospiraceae bacterium]